MSKPGLQKTGQWVVILPNGNYANAEVCNAMFLTNREYGELTSKQSELNEVGRYNTSVLGLIRHWMRDDNG